MLSFSAVRVSRLCAGLGGQPGQRPRPVPGEQAGQQRDRQRQEPRQLHHLRDLARAARGAGRQPGEHLRRLLRRQHIQQHRRDRAGQVAQVPAAGHQHQAPPAPGQQRGDLARAGRVIQHQQRPLPGHLVPPHPGPPVQVTRQEPGIGPRGGQQRGQRVFWPDRFAPGGVGVQVDEQLPVRELLPQHVRGVHRQGGLARPRHPADRPDRHHPARPGRTRHRRGDLAQLLAPAGERRRIRRQRIPHLRRRRRHRGQAGVTMSRVGGIGQADPPVLAGFLDRDQHPPPRGRGAPLGMADDFLVEPCRGDHREDARRPGQRLFQLPGLQQPERHGERGAGHPVRVMRDFPAMQRQPQPHPGVRSVPLVVRAHRRGQLAGDARRPAPSWAPAAAPGLTPRHHGPPGNSRPSRPQTA